MNISSASIKNPAPAIMLFVLLCLAGVLAFKAMPVQNFPDIDLPIIAVSATLEGAAAAQIETEIARKMEDAVATLEGVKHIHTSIRQGETVLLVQFVLEKNTAEALYEVKNTIDRIRADLPAQLRSLNVIKINNAGRAVLVFTAASSTLDEQELSWFVDNTAIKRLLAVPGVGAVKRLGGVDREVRIELDPIKMAALKLTALDVSRQLRRVQQEAPGGKGNVGGGEQSIRTIATVTSAAELTVLELPFPTQNGENRKIRLGQIAQVTDAVSERRSLALAEGKPVIGLEILRTTGASELAVAADTRAVLVRLQTEYPTVVFSQVIDNATPVKENVDGSLAMLYEGAVLAVLVVWWFLRDWRATLVAAVALPLSVIPAFFGMSLLGFTLNTVSLLALALVVGVLVDDAIVEIENIFRHLRMGKSPQQAATEATDEIGLAVIATTLALVAVFLPTAFMDGVAGKFFKQFGWTAVLAILGSLLVARLLTPMMAAYFLQRPQHPEPEHSGIMLRYLGMVRWCLRRRLATIASALVFFMVSVSLAGLLPTGFIPAADRAQTQINLELPPGSSLKETLAAAERCRLAVQNLPHVQAVFSSVGGGSSGDVFAPGAAAEVRRALLTLTLAHRDERTASIKDIEQAIRLSLAKVPGIRFQIGPPDSGVKMQIALQSQDPQALMAAAQRAERDLRTLKGIGGVTSSASLISPEITVRPDFSRASDLGTTAADIADTLRVATAGDYGINLPKLNLNERQVPVRVKLPDAVRTNLDTLAGLDVPGKNGPVKLTNVARIGLESGPVQIDRLDRSRTVKLDVELGTRSLGELYQEALLLPSLKNLPPAVNLAELGDTQEMQSLFASFGLAMAIGVLCLYGVLVLLFKDFMQPVTILIALPLSIGGAFVALLITHSALSMPSLIGLIMLMGIVSKNSILLVDYIIAARRHGTGRLDALVEACQKRSRPIVMTSIAMIAGMLPLALGIGADSSFRTPMAIAVIGGLVTSTLLSLLVVPVFYTYIDDAQQQLKKLFS